MIAFIADAATVTTDTYQSAAYPPNPWSTIAIGVFAFLILFGIATIVAASGLCYRWVQISRQGGS